MKHFKIYLILVAVITMCFACSSAYELPMKELTKVEGKYYSGKNLFTGVAVENKGNTKVKISFKDGEKHGYTLNVNEKGEIFEASVMHKGHYICDIRKKNLKMDEIQIRSNKILKTFERYGNTIADMHTLGTVLKMYLVNIGTFPKGNNINDLYKLKDFLLINGNTKQVKKDSWGNNILYRASDDGKEFSIASAGTDGEFNGWGRTNHYGKKNDDIIFSDVGLVKTPVKKDMYSGIR